MEARILTVTVLTAVVLGCGSAADEASSSPANDGETRAATAEIGDIGEPSADQILLPPPVSAEFSAKFSGSVTAEMREEGYGDVSSTGSQGRWQAEELTVYVYLTDRTAEEVARTFEEAFPESQLDIRADGWESEIELESEPLMGPPPDELVPMMKEMYEAQEMEWGEEEDEQMARYREVYPRLKDVVQTTGQFTVQDYYGEKPASYPLVDVVIERPFVDPEAAEVVDRTAISYHVHTMRRQD